MPGIVTTYPHSSPNLDFTTHVAMPAEPTGGHCCAMLAGRRVYRRYAATFNPTRWGGLRQARNVVPRKRTLRPASFVRDAPMALGGGGVLMPWPLALKRAVT